MKTRLFMIAALCLCLTACGTDAATAQQPTNQTTEQTVPTASVCKATVTEINGKTMIVKPADGSWELSSSDKFSLPASLLDEGITPAVGMTLEITYDGGVMEIYPAQFGNVQKVAVISETSDTMSPPSDSGTLLNDLEYEISKGDFYDSQHKQRGYYVDVVNSKYQYTICSGEKSTGGYDIKIIGIDTLDCGTVIVTAKETSPAPDEAVTEALTYPTCNITFSYEPPEGIIIKNTGGTEYECLGITTTEDKSPQYSLPRRAIMVNGILYLDTGYVSSMMRCGNLDGNIEKVIDSNEMPDEDGEANFSAEGWQRGFEEDTLDVRIENEYCIFAAEGTKKAENGYVPEGVMQFMATVDEVMDDGFVIVKTDTQSERFPQIQKDVRYRLSMEAYDSGIYTDKLVPGNVVIVACKGSFKGEDPVTITDVYSFSPVGSNVCQLET